MINLSTTAIMSQKLIIEVMSKEQILAPVLLYGKLEKQENYGNDQVVFIWRTFINISFNNWKIDCNAKNHPFSYFIEFNIL